MARAAIGMTRSCLAQRAGVSPTTLADFEAEKRSPYSRTLRDIKTVLEAEGISFIECNGAGLGVRYDNKK